MKLNCQLFLLLFLILNEALAQDISSGFQKSIDKFIEKIAGLKKNMKKLAAKREKLKSKKKINQTGENKELDSAEYKVVTDDTNDADLNLEILRKEEKLHDFNKGVSVNLGINENDHFDIDTKNEDETNLSEEVDEIEDSLRSESSFLDELLLKLNKKEDEKRNNKAKIKKIISRAKNHDFLRGLKEKTQRAKTEQRRLSGFLDRFRSSQSNLNRPRFRQDPFRDFVGVSSYDDDYTSSRFRQDPLTRFRDILGVPPVDDSRSIRLGENPLDLVEKRSLLGRSDIIPSDQVNKAFHLLDNIPGEKVKDGNIFVFTFADSNNPLLVFDG